MDRHSNLAFAAYADLISSLRDEQVAAILGTPRLEERNGRRYWYDVHRVGNSVKKHYIGEDDDQTRTRIERHMELASRQSDAARDRQRLIRLLRAEGFQSIDPSTGALLSALARAGTFRLGGTLVGTIAFRHYEGELGIRMRQTDMLNTGDIDIAQFERLSLTLGDTVAEPLAKAFADLDFAPVPTLDGTTVWRWRQSRSNLQIEFLTPSFRPEEDIRDLPALGVSAQSLHFLNYLIAEPIKAAALYRSGVLIQIPRPERFAIHKLIVADRRRGGPDQIKSRKDRAQAAFLIRILSEDRPEDLRDAWEDARARGPNWQTRLDASLTRMPETAALLAAL
jgi:hypothetical protein